VGKLPQGESARPLRTILREHIEDPLSLELLEGGTGEPLVVTVSRDEVVFSRPVPVL
jgi:ATP-dependent Clp protease ATP-binding subunit ClpA